MYVDPIGTKGCLKEGSKTSWVQDWAEGLLYGLRWAKGSGPVPPPARLWPFPHWKPQSQTYSSWGLFHLQGELFQVVDFSLLVAGSSLSESPISKMDRGS